MDRKKTDSLALPASTYIAAAELLRPEGGSESCRNAKKRHREVVGHCHCRDFCIQCDKTLRIHAHDFGDFVNEFVKLSGGWKLAAVLISE